ncbi:MAG: DUF2946 family protein [Rhodoferax sp.]
MQRRLFSHRHLVWLLWLVLLLPIAQTAATWHVLSHVNSDRVDEIDGQQAIHQGHCDLCLSAAALIGGAPALLSPVLVAARAPREPAVTEPAAIELPVALRSYQSRAPPIPLH